MNAQQVIQCLSEQEKTEMLANLLTIGPIDPYPIINSLSGQEKSETLCNFLLAINNHNS